MKNFSGITEDLDITTKKYVDDGLAGKANLAGDNTFTGGQTITGANAGYSVNASGYVKGSWLQSSVMQNKGLNTGKVCVFDNSGWIYYRTPAEILAEAGGAKSSDIPTNYVTTDTAQDITAEKKFLSNLIVGAKDDGSTGFKVIQGDDAGGDELFQVDTNGINLDAGGHDIPLLIDGSAGTDGQALLTQGAGKAPKWLSIPKLEGGNVFKGEQGITRDDAGALLNVTNALGDSFFQIFQNANNPDGEIFIGTDTAQTPISFDGNFGLEGQALLSQGSSHTPTWGDVIKHGYTELTNEDLNTITTPGWYRAASGNTCAHKPISSANSFVLIVEASSSTIIQQTFYVLGILGTFYKRYSNDGAATWAGAGWYNYSSVGTSSQTFSGRKTFSSGINLTDSLQVNGSAGTAGQVLTATASGAPVWADAGGSTDTMPTIRLVSIADIAGTCICSATNPLRFSFVVEKGTLLPTDMVQLCSRQLFTYKNGHMLRPGDPAVHGRTYKLRQFFSKEISAITLQQGHYVFEVNSYPELREFVRSNMNTGDRSTLIKYLRISRATQGEVPNHLFSNVIPIYVAPSAPSESAQTVKIRIR